MEGWCRTEIKAITQKKNQIVDYQIYFKERLTVPWNSLYMSLKNINDHTSVNANILNILLQ